MTAVYSGGLPEGYESVKTDRGRRPVTKTRFVSYVLDKNLSAKDLVYLSGFENVCIYPRRDEGRDEIRVYEEPEVDSVCALVSREARRNRGSAKAAYDRLQDVGDEEAGECSHALFMATRGDRPFYTDEDMERMYREDVERNRKIYKAKNKDKGGK